LALRFGEKQKKKRESGSVVILPATLSVTVLPKGFTTHSVLKIVNFVHNLILLHHNDKEGIVTVTLLIHIFATSILFSRK
jgi:hypothetical protein